MAATKGLTKPRLKNLRERLVKGLKEQGITAKVDLEPSGLAGRYRSMSSHATSKSFTMPKDKTSYGAY